MTREEAVKWFKENPFMHKDHEPFQMAIEALEKENNAIDRVLEILDDRIRYWTSQNKWSIPVEWVKESYEADREKILKLKRGEQE